MKHITIFLITGILFLTNISAFAQTEELLSITTSENSYEEGDTIVISGTVTSIILSEPVTIRIFYETTLIDVAQLDVAQDGSYTHTIIASGGIWSKDGTYTISAFYGGQAVETTITFFTKQAAVETTNSFEVDAGSSGTFDVDYTIRGATVKDMIIDSDIFALIVIIETEDNGAITLDLPRDSIDAKTSDGDDDTYIILIDGVEVPYEETVNSDSRVLTIEFEEGDSDIEIIGTFVIPEFGSISLLVLTLAIISAVLISTKKNLSIRL